MATRTYDAGTSVMYDEEVRGQGWLVFASALLGLAGVWNVIDGLLALDNSKVYGVNQVFVFSDLRTWGWIVLALGGAQLIGAFGVMTGSQFARWFGISVAGVNAIGQLAFLPVYPFWAIAMFAVDIVIIYALCVYGGRSSEPATA